MTLSQFFYILRARWKSALLVLLLTVGSAFVVSMLLPKKYTATASVMLDVRSPDPIGGSVLAGMMSPAYMATQVDLISSDRVARRAMKTLRMADVPGSRDQWREATEGKGDFEAWLAEALVRNLEVKPSRESNIISIGYSSVDAGFSAALANAFVQAYVDTALELRVDPARQYNSFFDARAKQLREDLETAQSKVSAYQNSKGLLATDGRFDIENSRLAELSTQLVMLQALAAESGNRQAQASERPDQMQEVLNNPVVAGLSSDLAREESRMKELTSRLGDNHPQVVEAKARLLELKNRIDIATTRASGSVNVNNSVNVGRVSQLRASIEAQRAKVMQLKTLRDEAGVLQRDVENAQRTYDMMSMRVNQTNIESKDTQTNISVIKRATPPSRPASPNLQRNILLAVFVGTLLAVGFALLRELLDRRLRTSADVLFELKQPLLVVLPKAKHSLDRKDNSRVRLLKGRVMTGLTQSPSKAQ
jgi:polysaccharide biosynthesis transport protein